MRLSFVIERGTDLNSHLALAWPDKIDMLHEASSSFVDHNFVASKAYQHCFVVISIVWYCIQDICDWFSSQINQQALFYETHRFQALHALAGSETDSNCSTGCVKAAPAIFFLF